MQIFLSKLGNTYSFTWLHALIERRLKPGKSTVLEKSISFYSIFENERKDVY
ncbi:hypothetical protein LEP1GSC036_0968 [Leptospira weilii str. 2006001853]|uniref:Uncharacterized protein n=1 Tax=Leptospira weilii str. 2006001853 TaxID=1001589 RepID=A0A828Z747_9LEPT|nr:hypothetical protein LEP1GSC036_0968 [Leptospira weilii str. 2006001853]